MKHTQGTILSGFRSFLGRSCGSTILFPDQLTFKSSVVHKDMDFFYEFELYLYVLLEHLIYCQVVKGI